MNNTDNQFDRAYRARIEKSVLETIMTTSTDPINGKTTVRSVEMIDALLTVVSLFAPMQVTSKSKLHDMIVQHQRVLKERTEKHFQHYQSADSRIANVRKEFR